MPARVRPLFTATIGFVRPTRRAISRNRRGFPNDSRYSRMTRVPGSCSQYSSRSLPETSALLPTLTNCEMPMPSDRAYSRIASPSAPLCDENATGPAGGHAAANVASRRTSSSRVEDAQAVRAHHAHAVAPRHLHQPALALDPLASDLLEAGADDDRRAYAATPALVEHGLDHRGRHHDDGQVGNLRQGVDRWKRAHRVHVIGLGVHGIHGALEAVAQQVLEDHAADASWRARGADHRDGAGAKQRHEAGGSGDDRGRDGEGRAIVHGGSGFGSISGVAIDGHPWLWAISAPAPPPSNASPETPVQLRGWRHGPPRVGGRKIAPIRHYGRFPPRWQVGDRAPGPAAPAAAPRRARQPAAKARPARGGAPNPRLACGLRWAAQAARRPGGGAPRSRVTCRPHDAVGPCRHCPGEP